MELVGKLLVAMPAMADPRFEHSVILLCAHSDDGAMGLIINKPARDMSFAGLLDHLNIPKSPEGRDIVVHFGGPVDRGRGFVLHSSDYQSSGTTMTVAGGFGMTATLDVLEAMAQGQGPENEEHRRQHTRGPPPSSASTPSSPSRPAPARRRRSVRARAVRLANLPGLPERGARRRSGQRA